MVKAELGQNSVNGHGNGSGGTGPASPASGRPGCAAASSEEPSGTDEQRDPRHHEPEAILRPRQGSSLGCGVKRSGLIHGI